MKTQLRKLTVIILAAIFWNCSMIAEGPPPYTITKPVFETSQRSYVFTYAGLSFYLMNNTQKTINSIKVSFMLFDSKTKSSPFIGSNIFEITVNDTIHPDENREILISLDKYVHTAPAEPYLIDYFHISQINYSDGSIWRDKYGTYNTGTLK